MTTLWTSGGIAAATGGVASADFGIRDVTFDSREVIGGELFVAMPGTVSDGHAHIPQAVARGATACLVSQAIDTPHVLVADTAAALDALAIAARVRTRAKVIGVTGSVGKTGVKEALGQAFERIAPGRVHRSVKSYNNHTGVPLSLSRMHAERAFAVYEMGMNYADELSRLTAMVRPDVALVTWVASAHRAAFTSEEAIADAKAEIFEGLEPGGTAVIPRDNAHYLRLLSHAERHAANVISFGEHLQADVRVLDAVPDATGTRLTARVGESVLHCRVAMPGRHWVSNALAVLAVVHAAGGDIGEAGLALADMAPLPGRGAQVRARGATILDESYNANPASMAAALDVLGAMPGRRVAVLGAMRELGAVSDELHAGLAIPIGKAGVAALALVGPEMAGLASLTGAAHLPDADAALRWAEAELRPGDVLLVKGSNSIGLARLVAALKDPD